MADLKKIAQQFGEKAAEMLRKVDTPEKAVALKGEERAKYLEVLDNVFGPQSKRASDVNYNTEVGKQNAKAREYLKQEGLRTRTVTQPDGRVMRQLVDKNDNVVGHAVGMPTIDVGPKGVDNYLDVKAGAVQPMHRGQGIYPLMLQELATDAGKLNKLSSTGSQRSPQATAAWEKIGAKADSTEIEPGDVIKDFTLSTEQARANLRDPNAAFDPRFKDSDLIMAANSEGPKSLKEVAQKYGSKALDLLSLPQRMAMNKAAQVLGLPGSPENSEESAAQIADKVVNQIVPANSEYLGPALKAAGTAGLEVFGDPTGAIGKLTKLGKLAKLGATAKKIGPVVEPTVEGIYKAIKPVRATEDINIVKNAAETYVGRKGLAEKKALGQLDAAPKMPENIPPALMAEAEQKAAAVYADELAAAQGNPMALKSLENRIETFKRLYIKPRM